MHLSPLLLALAAAAFSTSTSATAAAPEQPKQARATVACTSTAQCAAAGYALPSNAHYACNKARRTCTFSCNTGYTLTGSACTKNGEATPVVAARAATATAPSATPKLYRTYSGSSLLSQFTFWTAADPTHGQVTYVDAATAAKKGLASVTKSGTVLLSIDRTSKLAPGAKRESVRLSSKEAFDAGKLIIADFKHAPVGCGAWGAFWTYNYPWPQSGEIDIYEGVNARNYNQYTLHTAPGCTRSGKMTGSLVDAPSDCGAGGGSVGCTVFDRSPTSFGTGFNSAGGGVFAVLYAETGLSIWRWPRASIPADVKKGAPRWKSWGTPVAAFDGKTCDTRTFFKQQLITFDITTCGDWAGQDSVWRDPLQSGKCYPKYKTCSAAVQDPAAFKEAYFEVNYVKVFTV
ncbi:hypothetical protein JCM10207_003888 [Rhodosporidiobolus poonsookiae]